MQNALAIGPENWSQITS